MRDTKALQAARDAERDPYARRFTFPKWNRTVTVEDEPRLFRRLPEFANWTKARHKAVAREYKAIAAVDRAIYGQCVTIAERLYGTDGPLISGVHRDHYPEDTKETLRYFARRVGDFSSKSLAHWAAAGLTIKTWRQLEWPAGGTTV